MEIQPTETTAVTDIVKPSKLTALTNVIRNPKTLIVAGGAALAIAAGAVIFALKRSDEDDFEAEQEAFDAEDAAAEAE